MKLSKRLKVIYDLIEEGAVVGDVGCDHALLPCALMLNEKAKKVYACDINEEPLKQAKKSLEYYKLEDQVEIIHCAGVDKLPNDVDTVVIAGMGYETIRTILEQHPKKIKQYKHIIIQSNRDVEKIRKYISDHQFHIQKEVCVFDLHYYQIIVFDCNKGEELTKREILFGKRMEKDNVFMQMWFANYRKYELILKKLPKSNDNYANLKEIMNLIDEEIDA